LNQFEPQDPQYRNKVEESFNQQEVMKTIGATLLSVEPGRVEIDLAYSIKLTQQDGFLHAGIVSTVVDSACGYSAFSLMPEGTSVLSIEFKINFLKPAMGERFKAIGRVRKPGRTITVTEGELIAYGNNTETAVATMAATMMCLKNRENE